MPISRIGSRPAFLASFTADSSSSRKRRNPNRATWASKDALSSKWRYSAERDTPSRAPTPRSVSASMPSSSIVRAAASTRALSRAGGGDAPFGFRRNRPAIEKVYTQLLTTSTFSAYDDVDGGNMRTLLSTSKPLTIVGAGMMGVFLLTIPFLVLD